MSLKKELARKIYRHAEHTFPEESCGYLVGDYNYGIYNVEKIFPVDNSQDENRSRRFLITPKQYLQAERIASENGMELLGFYHSHPDHPAVPSAFDTEHALPHFVYIIASIMSGRAKNMRAWKLAGTREKFIELDMQPGKTEGEYTELAEDRREGA